MPYVNITLDEMKAKLQSEKGWTISDCSSNEYAFDYRLKNHPHIIVRVFSSIRKDHDNSRGVGQDSIKVFAFDEQKGKGIVSSVRVYRTNNWRDNLEKVALRVIRLAKERVR